MIDKMERERRKKSVEYSIATCELEGGIIPDEHKILYEQYINGDISLDELGSIIRAQILPKK